MCPSQAQLFNRNKNYNTKRIHSLVYASWTPNEKNVRWFKKVRTKLVRTKFGHRTKKTFGVQNWYVLLSDWRLSLSLSLSDLESKLFLLVKCCIDPMVLVLGFTCIIAKCSCIVVLLAKWDAVLKTIAQKVRTLSCNLFLFVKFVPIIKFFYISLRLILYKEIFFPHCLLVTLALVLLFRFVLLNESNSDQESHCRKVGKLPCNLILLVIFVIIINFFYISFRLFVDEESFRPHCLLVFLAQNMNKNLFKNPTL